MRRTILCFFVVIVIGSWAMGQIILSSEKLVSTTFLVSKERIKATCHETGCIAKTPMFAPVALACPAQIGLTCTFHISLDSKVSFSDFCNSPCHVSGPMVFFEFLVDGKVPTIGPTDKSGDYIVQWNFQISGGNPVRQSYPASLLAVVRNRTSENHQISVSVGCRETNDDMGCEALSHWTTMRVDVFEP
jgi:hypothetical protein